MSARRLNLRAMKAFPELGIRYGELIVVERDERGKTTITHQRKLLPSAYNQLRKWAGVGLRVELEDAA